jgi:hypothetical protein
MSVADRIRLKFGREVIGPLDASLGVRFRRLRNAGRDYRPIFVAGAMGSGTTVLAFMLGQQFECGSLVAESARQISRHSFLYTPHLSEFPSIRAYEGAISPKEEWSVERGREELLDLYRSFGSGPGEVAIDKGPNTNLMRAGFLAQCFPEAQFVCVFRDPVANVEGFRRKWETFGRDSLEESIRFYELVYERFFELAGCFPGRFCVVEYEAFVARTDATLAALAGGLGLEPAKSRRRMAYRPNVPGQGVRNVHRSRIEIVGGSTSDSYARLEPEAVARVKEALGALHERMRAQTIALDPSGAHGPRSTRSA